MANEPAVNGDSSSHQDDETVEIDKGDENTSPATESVEAAEVVDDNREGQFSWLEPHPIFVIALVGPEETPFGIQKDFLCAKSSYYRRYVNENPGESLELLVKLPTTPVEVFSHAQNFMYTGTVVPSLENLPSYEVLIGVWKLGHELGIHGLCDATLDAMTECRRITQHIPATPLLVQVWKDTPEGSSIRMLLLSWAAEYMRSSDSRAEFARSLPQHVLSELVVAMSSLDSTPAAEVAGNGGSLGMSNSLQRRNIHYLDTDEAGEMQAPAVKKQRVLEVLPNGSTQTAAKPGRKRTSLPGTKTPNRRRSGAAIADMQFTSAQKLSFCSDLLTRMLSGPGFWTRLVGPFKEPVDPATDGVPDYFEKVKKPMDLGTMKEKMDRKEYTGEEDFLADVNQIFSNCYAYWSQKDPMWAACERLQKTFEEKFGQMNKWLSKMEGAEEG